MSLISFSLSILELIRMLEIEIQLGRVLNRLKIGLYLIRNIEIMYFLSSTIRILFPIKSKRKKKLSNKNRNNKISYHLSIINIVSLNNNQFIKNNIRNYKCNMLSGININNKNNYQRKFTQKALKGSLKKKKFQNRVYRIETKSKKNY